MRVYFISFIQSVFVVHQGSMMVVTVNRIGKVSNWIEHLKKLGANAIYFSPIFESDSHGYDTRDFTKIDCRLGTNEDFAKVCDDLHKADIKVVLDGVFNHVGRGFWAFKDVQEKKMGLTI